MKRLLKLLEIFIKEICNDKLDNLSAITVKLPTDNVKIPGIYYYLCTPHKAMGMIGLVVVGGDISNKDDIAKAKALGKSKKKLKKK